MSNRFSTSPTLRLSIADSPRYRACQLIHCVACLAACVLVGASGHIELAALCALFIGLWSPQLVAQPWVGWQLGWHGGGWTLDRCNGNEPVQLERASRVGPGGIYLSLRDMRGVRYPVWILADAVPHEARRRLRVRLTLERGV